MSHWMKRGFTSALPLAALVFVAVLSYGQTAAPRGGNPPAAQRANTGGPGIRKYVTVRGEILDLGCYTAHGLRGTIHRQCATQCLAQNVPMGLITPDSVVYTLTQNHDRAMAPTNFPPPDPYAQCRSWASFQVEVAGFMWDRKGVKYLEVMASKPSPPEESK